MILLHLLMNDDDANTVQIMMMKRMTVKFVLKMMMMTVMTMTMMTFRINGSLLRGLDIG